MRFLKAYFRQTPQVIAAIFGLASALMVLEIQRMPAAHIVSLETFAPGPYTVEACIIALIALMYKFFPAHRLSNSQGVRVVVSLLVVVSTLAVLLANFSDASLAFVMRALYRTSSGLLVCLWAERLISLGSRRAAWTFACACMLSGVVTALLALLSFSVSQLFLMALPFICAACFIFYKPQVLREDDVVHEDGEASEANKDNEAILALEKPLPRFACSTKKTWIMAVGLVFLPLLCRGAMAVSQSSWIALQQNGVMISLIQATIGLGILLGGIIIAFVVRHAWNQSFILVFDLFVIPASFIFLYTGQRPDDLWVLHMLIVDSTYKVMLFYIAMTAFLFPGAARGENAGVPIFAAFSFMIITRALFFMVKDAFDPAVSAGIEAVVVLVSFGAACWLAFQVLQKQLVDTEKNKQASAEAVRKRLENQCEELSAQFDLTPREQEILLLLAQNYRAPYIAERLVVSQSTVKTHMRNLYAKLGVHSQAELLLLVEEKEQGVSVK